MGKRSSGKRKWGAALLAGVLTAAIALTSTLAWRSMSQKTVNEFLDEKNPGGRIHDDFNGVENKDIYAENFTDTETGSPVFVRVKLLEYMETGDDAGINRDAADRKATPLVDGTSINEPDKWPIHKPDTASHTDPFHDYWEWTEGGETIYMPTFNKNKDSLSVEVNGTYVGTDGDFETGEPYDDYVTYTDGQESDPTMAYYDADDNDTDEYDATATPPQVPGGGGTEYDKTTNPDGNYTKVEEKHTAQSTLKGLGVITMKEWIDGGKKVCNKWVWDEDGWFYWPEPVMPQSATGLLLNQVINAGSTSGKCYYAINVVGQFTDKDSIGTANTATGSDPSNATGFYVDGITANAVELLNQAASVRVSEDNRWFLPLESAVYKQIVDDEGNLSDGYFCAGADGKIGTADDRTDVEYVEAGVTVGATNYGKYFLKPTATEVYYRAPGADRKLGTKDDARLWVTAGDLATGTVVDKVVDTVTVAPADAGGKAQVILGETLNLKAAASLGGTEVTGETFTWKVEPTTRAALAAGTKVENGVLTVDENETNTALLVTATSVKDDRQSGSLKVTVLGKPNLKLALPSSGENTVEPGGTLQLSAKFCYGDEPLNPQPAITWDVGASTDGGTNITSITNVTITDGLVSLPADYSITDNGNTLYAKASATVESETYSKAIQITVPAPTALTVSVKNGGDAKVKFRSPLELEVTVQRNGKDYASKDVTWSVEATDAAKPVMDFTKVDPGTGALSVDARQRSTTVVVKAASKADASVEGRIEVEILNTSICLDGLYYQVLKIDRANNRALILSEKRTLSQCWFADDTQNGTDRLWHDNRPHIVSALQTFVDGCNELKSVVLQTQIKTRKEYNSTEFAESTDRVLLLSEADLFGTFAGQPALPDDYTAGEQLFHTDNDRALGTNTVWWLRSPASASKACVVTTEGTRGEKARVNDGSGDMPYPRAAFWVDLTQDLVANQITADME